MPRRKTDTAEFVAHQMKKLKQTSRLAELPVGQEHKIEPSDATHDDTTGPLPLSLTAGPARVAVAEYEPNIVKNDNITPLRDPLDVAMETNVVNGQAQPTPFTDPSTQGTKDQIEKIEEKNELLTMAKEAKSVFDNDTYDMLAKTRRDPEAANNYLKWVIETNARDPKSAFVPPNELKDFDPQDYHQNNYFAKLQSWRNNYQMKLDMTDPKNAPSQYAIESPLLGKWWKTKQGYDPDPAHMNDERPPGRFSWEKGPKRPLPSNFGEYKPLEINALTDHTPDNLPQILEREQNILRAHFDTATAADVTPTPQRQLQSDMLFDMFSVVPPGYGLGSRNKLFVENEQRDEFLRFRNNFFIRADQGAPTGIVPVPWYFQDTLPVEVLQDYVRKQKETLSNTILAASTTVGRTVGALPADVDSTKSSRGLLRPLSFLRPVIENDAPLTPTIDPAGVYLNGRTFRHLYSPWRSPTENEDDVMGGGSHFRTRRALVTVNP